jgi:hypothetical protein
LQDEAGAEERWGVVKMMSMSRAANAAWLVAGCLALALCFAGVSQADTIVLKNGRRIVVSNVIREQGKVSGETSAGRLSLPESMVARIEKDDSGASLAGTTNLAAADLPIGPPPVDPLDDSDPIARTVVHDGAIDREALARLDAGASSGNTEAAARAAVVESAASQFEFGRGDFAAALAHAERALSHEPAQVTLLLNLAYLHLRRSEYTAALDSVEHARRVAPDSPEAAKLAGWAEYGLNRLPQAIAEWKRAQQLQPDDEVGRALEKAERDAEVETNFREGESAHFALRYSGSAAPDLARGILGELENSFQVTSSLLNYTPAEPIAVVLYTGQDFADITRAPSWAGALNDGRIRIPVQGLLTVTPQLARVLRHELAHSFISQKTHGNCAVWLQEGIAEWLEGARAGDDAAALIALYDRHDDPSLAALEGSWLNLPNESAHVAYAWSLAVVEGMVQAGTSVDLERLLDGLAAGSSTEAATRDALHMDYADLNRSTVEYLRRTYLH